MYTCRYKPAILACLNMAQRPRAHACTILKMREKTGPFDAGKTYFCFFHYFSAQSPYSQSWGMSGARKKFSRPTESQPKYFWHIFHKFGDMCQI